MTLPDDPSFSTPGPLDRTAESRSVRQTQRTRARRRRRTMLVVPPDATGRAALIASLAHRSYPTYELFVYSVLCGSILGLGYVLDSQALLIFGVLVAPLLTPWVGLLLATVTGSPRFFFETLIALFVSGLMVFLIGALAGFAAQPFMPRTFDQAFAHSRLWWPELIVLAVGAVILTISFVRSEAKPFLPSVMVAYGLFLPISAAGFGLGSAVSGLWPHGLLVFAVYFAWTAVFGLVTLMALRFVPANFAGFAMTAMLVIALVATLLWLMGASGKATPAFVPLAPTATSSITPSPLPTINAQLPAILPADTNTPVVAMATATLPPSPVPLTLQVTLPPTASPTITLTIEPTPVYARIKVSKGGGAVLRESPGGKGITVMDNYSIVQVLPDTQDISGTTWAHVIANLNGNQIEGWMVQLYLDVATPAPNWAPSATLSFTPTP